MKISPFFFAIFPSLDFLYLNMSDDIGHCEYRFFFETISIERFEIEQHFFLAIFKHAIDSTDIWPIFDLIIQQLHLLPFDIFHDLHRFFSRSSEHIFCPTGASPKNVDIYCFLNILLFDVFVQFLNILDLVPHFA